MISEELRKYIDLVNSEWENGQLYEMARVGYSRHGIENVVIWVGEAPKQHGLRVKVSNIPNKMRVEDSFTIMMPSLDYDPGQVPNWITPKIMKRILEWIKLNQKQLYEYETGVVFDTDDFLNSLIKV
ncbi:hypothetical protein UFOVP116_178 [uncultured Caudovirales phage]|uniref:Uncharacterized protein n=1 Tax=uncultured Caudovirales phage TaxID=2100421 RepID=A0A6J5LA28_9CAUD|nr:hypothetical protein UFOVP116_178 [uncultured Caudovirales phage]